MAILECKICNKILPTKQGWTSHHRGIHNLSRKDIFDLYFKTEKDGKCSKCGKETQFRNNRHTLMYNKYCSFECGSKDSILITKLNSTPTKKMKLTQSLNGKNTKFSKELLNIISERRSERNRSGIDFKRVFYKSIQMKSSWEVEFAKLCDKNKLKWQYEPKTFVYGSDNRFRYTPDFLINNRVWVEIKPLPLINEQVISKGKSVSVQTGQKWEVLHKKQFTAFIDQVKAEV